ncbi:MAG: DegT/DnrJ/EryC1/StrS family aminotransferase [Armatimonadetes bacterium]|nr:DegT/DnrJ/EryC1/StrS family aminotransferase [Armatimonadota bacterium]
MRIFDDRELGYLEEVLDSGVLGWRREGMTGRFERAFAEFVGAQHAISRSSAMTGLAQAVSCSPAGWGSEVICDPIVQFGGLAALNEMATPVFADVEPDTLLMDPASVRRKITERTRALIVTNLWGLCARLDELRAICDAHRIFMIEDCAHTTRAYWKGKHAGTRAHVGVFSFQQGKHLPTGDGGMIVTDDPAIDEMLYGEWAFGETPKWFTLNFRMNELTAAVGLAQLERVSGYVDTYNACQRHLDEAIKGCRWLKPRAIPPEAVPSAYTWLSFWDGDRYGMELARFQQIAREKQVPLRFGFIGKPAYLWDCFQAATDPDHPGRAAFKRHPLFPGPKYREGDCPVAEERFPRLINCGVMLPTEEQGRQLAERLRAAIETMERG